MKVTCEFISNIKLHQGYYLLSMRDVSTILEAFKSLDARGDMALDSVQFYEFMDGATDLSKEKIHRVFDMLDVRNSGKLGFDKFYILVCILIAVRDKQEREFIFRHSGTIFNLLDKDASNAVSVDEFEGFGFLLNFQKRTIRQLFREFDVSGDQELDCNEFKTFAFACIDRQREIERGHGRWYPCTIL